MSVKYRVIMLIAQLTTVNALKPSDAYMRQ